MTDNERSEMEVTQGQSTGSRSDNERSEMEVTKRQSTGSRSDNERSEMEVTQGPQGQSTGSRSDHERSDRGVTSPLVVTAPIPGTVLGLEAVPDPVFAGRMVGPGAAIDPRRAPLTAVAPVAGTLVKLKPHAFVVTGAEGRAVLVHLGIDTVTLGGDGFTLLAAEGDQVEAGAPVVSWDPAAVEASGRSPVCPVVALDADSEAVREMASGQVTSGQPLFRWS